MTSPVSPPHGDPSRRCWPVAEWPAPDQAMWHRLTTAGDDVFDDAGVFAHWSRGTSKRMAQSHGRWINYAARAGLRDVAPADRITRDTVKGFVAELASQVAPSTLDRRIDDLLVIARAASPEREWDWLSRIAARLRWRAGKAASTAPVPVSTDDLIRLGLQQMNDAEVGEVSREDRGPTIYRTGLMVALLAVRPLRIANLTRLTIGRDLIETQTGFRIAIPGAETKTGEPIEVDLPDFLVPLMRRYLGYWRPALLKDDDTDRLWVSRHGRPMTDQTVYEEIRRLTEGYLGVRLNPHAFRSIAVSSFADLSPKNQQAAMHLLGHRSFTTTQQHYLRAEQKRARRGYQDALIKLGTPGRKMRKRRRRRGG